MNRILQQLLANIENAAVERERWARDAQTRMPMPQSDFLLGLPREEAKRKFDEFLFVFLGNSFFKDSLQPSRHTSTSSQFKKLLEPNDGSLDFGKTSIELFYPAGYDLAFKLAHTGAEGGIHQLIRTMFDNMTEWSVKNEVKRLVEQTWGNACGSWTEWVGRESIEHKTPLHGELEERAKHVRAYKEAYRAFLPGEYLEQSDLTAVFNFDEVLRNHNKLIQRMRGLID